MNFVDRQRIEWVLVRYDFWMDSRGVPRKARKGLREELRANLIDATDHEGSQAAVRAIGSPQALAYAAGEAHEGRPRWTYGAVIAGLVLGALVYAWMFSMLGFADGVTASGVTGRTVVGVSFPWGTELTARVEPGNGGFSTGGTFPWVIPLLALTTFVLAAQPWRPLSHRRGGARAASQQRA